ncbi:MAG: flagellar biosynthesis protein FlhB [Legionella sp. 40-6]|nr:MAG: flagellar biosynthesis protein FlhB [Legionella sp. 40-6]
MADMDHEEKTEDPSAKRLREAREKGQTIRSKDFNTMMALIFAASIFFIFGNHISRQMLLMMQQSFTFDIDRLITVSVSMEHVAYLLSTIGWVLLPLFVLLFIVPLGASLILGGWVFSREQMLPKLSRLNPLGGFKRMVALKSYVEMIKAFLKFLVVLTVALIVLKTEIPALMSLAHTSIETAIHQGALIVATSFIWVASSLLFIAAIDVPFQIYEHRKSMRMSKQELRDEYKETEGKPEIKSAIRRAQQEISRRRMLAEVPKADVVLTNPSHYAIALKYKDKGAKAPVVVAKGKNLIAFQITREAQNHAVPVLAVPPLARAIYYSTKLNAEIPRGLYIAVAQVLAYVFQLRDKKRYDHKPEILQNVPIPDELAREEDAE